MRSFACLALLVLCGRAHGAEPAIDAARALSELDQVGRAIAKEKCQRPLEVKAQLVAQPLAADATDEMQSHACRGFRVAVYVSTLAASTRELPMSVVVESRHPLLANEWSVGATPQNVRARLGAPYSAAGESFSYSLRAERPGRDTLTFEVEGGIVRAVTWSWDID
jgi:hypothetical protein